MSCEKIAFEQAKQQLAQYPYAMLQYMSSVFLGANPGQVDWEELFEARFFGPAGELHIFDTEQGFAAVVKTDGAHTIESEWKLEKPFGKTLLTRKTLAFDEDGQAYVCETRLSGWEGH